jgi:hypothetical protein
MWPKVLVYSSGFIKKRQPDGGWRTYRQCCGSVWRRQCWCKASMPRQGTDYADETPSQAEFQECCCETIIKNCLSPSLVDDPLFRKTLVTTDRMGQSVVWMVKGTTLGKRTLTHHHMLLLRTTLSNSTNNIVCTTLIWWRGEGWCSWYFHPRNDELPQATWIETFVEGVTDKSTGLSIFKELPWFVYKVSGVMWSVSACDHCWSIEGWIHSKRRNETHQKLVEKLVRSHTNLLLRGSLDDTLHHLLPWDMTLISYHRWARLWVEEEPEV